MAGGKRQKTVATVRRGEGRDSSFSKDRYLHCLLPPHHIACCLVRSKLLDSSGESVGYEFEHGL